MTLQKESCNIGAIFGAGRSGTTWLGSIVDSHPDVAYRFEPLHRLKKKTSEIARLLDLIRSSNFSADELSHLYQALLPAYPECDKPPYFPKNYSMVIPFGRSPLWTVTQNNAFAGQFFRMLYTPQGTPSLIFKEVALVDVFCCLLEQTEMPLVYLMRHPCAVVWSVLRGQKAALMPDARRQFLQNLMETHHPSLAERYGNRLETLSVVEQEALLWRVDVERAVEKCLLCPKGLLVIYEELVEHPMEISAQVFEHFGLTMVEQSRAFIEESTTGSSSSRLKRWEFGINPYFTVFRDSKASSSSWKGEMPEEDQNRVLEIVQDSKPFAIATNRGMWG